MIPARQFKKSTVDPLAPPAYGPHLPLRISSTVSFDPRAVRRISSITAERNNPKKAKKSHASDNPLQPLLFHPTEVLGRTFRNFWKKDYKPPTSLASKPVKSLEKSPSTKRRRQARPKNRFVDDSAVEVNSHGSVVSSRESSPEPETHPSNASRRLQGDYAIPKLIDLTVEEQVGHSPDCHDKPRVLPVKCEICDKTCSGPAQLKLHKKSKKCRNRQDYKLKHKCYHCFNLFETSHDLNRHLLKY